MHSWTLAKRENNNVKYSFLKEVILKKKKNLEDITWVMPCFTLDHHKSPFH